MIWMWNQVRAVAGIQGIPYMRDDAVRAYASPPVSAEQELGSLGTIFAEDVLLFCAKIVAGAVDHWTLLPFHEDHRGVPVYKYAHGTGCALLAVEDDGLGERTVSIMLAARTGGPCTIEGRAWNGVDMNALRAEFLLPRLRIFLP